MNFSKKILTKLLNPEFRKNILNATKSIIQIESKKIKKYSQYVINDQISQRVKEYSDDRTSGWGFPQFNFLCCVKDGGLVEKKFFEFKTINHFLKDHDEKSALEVLQCMLLLWASEDKQIQSFDCDLIEEDLAQLDDLAKKQQLSSQQEI